MTLSRKEFLRRGVLSVGELLLKPLDVPRELPASPAMLRPPGFVGEGPQGCGECRACMDVCPERVLTAGEGGVPVFSPRRGACTFCLKCIAACPREVLRHPDDREVLKLGRAEADNGRCLAQRGGCFSCLERCPEEALAIELGTGIRIDGERCTGCGACEHVCPLEPGAVRVRPLPGRS